MFRYSICDPLRKDPIEMGEIAKEEIPDVLARFPWADFLARIDNNAESDIHYSPSLEFENKLNRHCVTISIIEENEFYIFYNRPKMITKLFGLIKNMDENFSSDRPGQTLDDVRDAVTALINDDFGTLEKRWG